jgi:hypothetical protein
MSIAWPGFKWSDAQLRTLEVDQNADRAPTLFLQRPNHCSLRPELIMSGMAHIDAKKIDPGLKHRRRSCLDLPTPVRELQ